MNIFPHGCMCTVYAHHVKCKNVDDVHVHVKLHIDIEPILAFDTSHLEKKNWLNHLNVRHWILNIKMCIFKNDIIIIITFFNYFLTAVL